jgi:hypothetical protein
MAVIALSVEDDRLQVCFELRKGLVVVIGDCSHLA